MEAESLSRVIRFLEKIKKNAGEHAIHGDRRDRLKVAAAKLSAQAFKKIEEAAGESRDLQEVEPVDVSEDIPINLRELTRCLATVTADIKSADELLNHTIQMVFEPPSRN